MKTHILFLSVIFILFVSSCARVQIYKDKKAKCKHKIPIKVYQPKPYLLVEYNPAKDVKIKTSFIYLPDLANPLYLKQKGFIGSSSLEFSLANGQLASFGATSDSKIPEMITAIGSLAGLVEAFKNGDDSGGLQNASTEILKKLDSKLALIEHYINNYNLPAGLALDAGQTSTQNNILSEIGKARVITRPRTPNKDDEVKGYLKAAMGNVKNLPFASSTNRDKNNFNVHVENILKLLDESIKILPNPLSKSDSYFKLYEISIKEVGGNKKLDFNEVDFP